MTLTLFYLFCLLVGLVYSLIAVLLGGDHDTGGHDLSSGDLGSDVSHGEVSFSPLSPIVIASFITAFGAGGLISHYAFKISGYKSIPVAIFLGLAVGSIVFYIFLNIFKATQSSSEAVTSTLVGNMAEVITPISENGLGEVAYIIRGSRYTAPAKSSDGQPIHRNKQVKIINIVGSTIVVEDSEIKK